jgi:N-acetylmuramoyl-L-alanine amidase
MFFVKEASMLRKIHNPSPNFEPRPPGTPPDMIILHYTDMLTAEEALTRLCDPISKVSAHFLISKEGELYQLVDPKYRAWHAGLSSWAGEKDINSRSIGIEMDNLGHTFGPEPFPIPQMNRLLDLLAELTEIYGIPAYRIVGHSDVAPLRKQDPGELFPWHDLAKKGFGLWPKDNSSSFSPSTPLSFLEVQQALQDIGYGCPLTGIWDDDSQKVCRAFQQHFTPSELTGYPSQLTYETLQELLKVVRSLKSP